MSIIEDIFKLKERWSEEHMLLDITERFTDSIIEEDT